MKEAVEAAIAEITEAAVGTSVNHLEDGEGGAFVIVEGVPIGDSFNPVESWIGFHILWTCPQADVYPHFTSPDLRYQGGELRPNQHPEGNLPAGLTRGANMPGFNKAAIQVSRRSNRRDHDTDTPLEKLFRITDFLRGL